MRRFLALVVLAASAAVVPPAHAGPVLFTVRGTRAGYVDVTFPKPFTVDTYGWIDSRKGTYGGFWAERIGQPAGETPDTFGVIRIKHEDTIATARLAKPADDDGNVVYAAGRYRIHAVADGAFSMALPVDGLPRKVTVSPRHHVTKPRFTRVAATDVGRTTWEAREPITIGPKRMVAISISFARWDLSGSHQTLLCFTQRGGACETERHRLLLGNVMVSNTTGHLNTNSYFAPPGLLPNGQWDAYQRLVTNPGVVFRSVHGMALVFDAPAGR